MLLEAIEVDGLCQGAYLFIFYKVGYVMLFSRLDRYISQTCCLEVLCPRPPLYKLFPALKRMQLHLPSNGQAAEDYITVLLKPRQLHQLAITVSHSSSLSSLNQHQELGQTRLVRHPTSETELRN